MTNFKLIKQIALHIVFILLCLLVLYPFLLVVAVSFSNEKELIEYGYQLIPKSIDLSAYKFVFSNPKKIIDAYKVTIIFSFSYMFLSVTLMAGLAYVLSKRGLKGRRFVSLYIYFTTLFSGGLVPTYILNTQYLNLDDTIWIYILPGLIVPWYVFMMRTFFQDIPYEITESATIDGANEYVIFFKMILPLSKPVLAAVALFMFLAKWGDWNTAMLYINKDELISLQYLLQRIMENLKILQENSMDMGFNINVSELPSESARMAMAIVVAGPALVIFPFFQKYFVKGLTVGSVKG